MNEVNLFVLFFLHLFVRSEQLTCLSDCQTVYAKAHESIDLNSCVEISSNVCQLQLAVYYQGNTFVKYFNYTFGYIPWNQYNNEDEQTDLEYIQIYGLINFVRYQFVVNANQNETILLVNFYCTNHDDCQLDIIKQLTPKYTQQMNPFYQIQSLIYSKISPRELICFNSETQENQQCSSNSKPICLSNSMDSVLQQCSSELDVHIHYKFTVSSPETTACKRTEELIQCNKDYCNSQINLNQLENFAKYSLFDRYQLANIASKQSNSYFLLHFILYKSISNKILK